MPLIMIALYCFLVCLTPTFGQVATVCPSGSPPTSGNSPDTYYSNLLPLTPFLQLNTK